MCISHDDCSIRVSWSLGLKFIISTYHWEQLEHWKQVSFWLCVLFIAEFPHYAAICAPLCWHCALCFSLPVMPKICQHNRHQASVNFQLMLTNAPFNAHLVKCRSYNNLLCKLHIRIQNCAFASTICHELRNKLLGKSFLLLLPCFTPNKDEIPEEKINHEWLLWRHVN